MKRGMIAMHEAMMKNMPGTMMPGCRHDGDSAFGAMQERGKQAMGVDQYTSAHLSRREADGGRIELQRDVDDTAGVAAIRRHLQEIAIGIRLRAISASPVRTHAECSGNNGDGRKARRDHVYIS